MTTTDDDNELPLAAIEEIRVHRARIPLAEPYRTALGDLHQLDAILCLVRIGDRWVAGEACAVAGYNQETAHQVWETVRTTAQTIRGGSALDSLRILERTCSGKPFARATVATALEQLLWPPPAAIEAESLQFVATVNEHDPVRMPDEVLSYLERGYRTLKLKVGLDAQDDIRRVKAVAGIVGQAAMLRLDANQQYGYADALRLVGEIDTDKVELLEQPFAPDSWELTSRLCSISEVPIMLDESISSKADVARASDVGASAVKFKLMKSGSCRDLSEDIALARGLGLNVVVGNGVASDIGCFPEIVTCVNSGVTMPIESNGFLKTGLSLLDSPLRVSNGMVTVTKAQPVVNIDLIDSLTISRWTAD